MTEHADDRSGLVAIIHEVRRRWRMKLAVRGVALMGACAAAALIVSAWGLQWMRFTPESILLFRIAIGVLIALLAYVFLIRPQLRRVTDEQVALYLEEHEPSLEAAIISAVEAGTGDRGPGTGGMSPALVQKLVETAVEKCRAVDAGRRVERLPIRRYSGALGGVLALAALVFLLGPAYMRHALSALLVISRSVEAAAPYRIEVSPGAKTIPRGADQVIGAKLIGFEADQASLMIRKSATAAFEKLPLIKDATGGYAATLFDVAAPIDYFVEAVGVRSSVYSLKVADMPYVQRLELEYVFPSYTGLPPRTIEDGGDIAVLRGTQVRVRAVPTMHADAGGIVIDDKNQVPLAVGQDGALSGQFVADHDGFYRIDLTAPGGANVNGSPKYSIDVLDDHAPTVSFSKPGRDTSASPIEEVFLEAKADDDYGIRSLNLVYSVNGGPEQTLKLFDGAKSHLASVVAGHTLYLEEMNVKPGDSVSYYAQAYDNNTVGGSQKATSDMYFIRVRPLEKDFRKADSNAGGGGGGQQNQVGRLSQQEREIIAATFNLNRDRKTMSADKLKQGTVVVALMQKRLRDQVNELLTNFATRVGDQAAQFKALTEFLKQSLPEMQGAESKLQAAAPERALPPEQRALEFLQKAEEEYQVQVAMSRQGGGGGGGQQNQMADELADLFQLQADKMSNQYETSQRASDQQNDQKIDELAEKLKDLARRQEQEAERQRRMAASGQSSSAGGDTQRALADQAEEAARQLEKLAREENKPQLQQTARELQQAADAMRQAAANGDPNSAAAASRAIDQLKRAQQQLAQAQSNRGGRDVQDALRQAEQLAREQQQIKDDVSKLDSMGDKKTQKIQELSERKDTLAGQVDQLQKQLDQTAGAMFKNDRDAARKMSEASGELRDRRIRDRIRYSDSMLRAGAATPDVQAFEQDIQNGLDDVKQKLSEAAAAVGHNTPDTATQTLDKARQLAAGMQSLSERMRAESGQQRQNGQTGQNGQQQNQQGQQPGRQGQQSGQQSGQQQAGQQGQQSGQQGQQPGQQGGQQGQQGENGQGGQGNQQATRGGGGAGPMTGGRPAGARFSPEDVRQFRAEARQREQDTEQLRRLLQQQKLDTKDLDQIQRQIKQLEDAGVYQDADALAKLESAIAENAKRFEYTLRRKLDANASEVFLSGTDDVPEQYRKQVEQYYRALSKASGGGKQSNR